MPSTQKMIDTDAGDGGKNNNSNSSNLHLLHANCVPGTGWALCVCDLIVSSSHFQVGINPVFIY